MDLGRKILAAVLALIIANPICCCAFGDLASGSNASACCSEVEMPLGQPAPCQPTDGGGCPCTAEKDALVEAKSKQVERVDSELLALSRRALGVFAIIPRQAPFVQSKGQSLPPPDAVWRRYCRFLL